MTWLAIALAQPQPEEVRAVAAWVESVFLLDATPARTPAFFLTSPSDLPAPLPPAGRLFGSQGDVAWDKRRLLVLSERGVPEPLGACSDRLSMVELTDAEFIVGAPTAWQLQGWHAGLEAPWIDNRLQVEIRYPTGYVPELLVQEFRRRSTLEIEFKRYIGLVAEGEGKRS